MKKSNSKKKKIESKNQTHPCFYLVVEVAYLVIEAPLSAHAHHGNHVVRGVGRNPVFGGAEEGGASHAVCGRKQQCKR